MFDCLDQRRYLIIKQEKNCHLHTTPSNPNNEQTMDPATAVTWAVMGDTQFEVKSVVSKYPGER